MPDYALEGVKWGSAAQGSAGGTVTWAYDGTVPAFFASTLASAFAGWSSYGNIQFQQVASTSAAQIDLHLGAIDGPNGVVGLTNFQYSGVTLQSADVTFDSGEGWHASGGRVVSNSGIDFLLVALHEVGHAIGLDHYNASVAVMNSFINPSLAGLTISDVDGIRALYGPLAQSAPPPTPSFSDVFRFFDTKTGHHFYTKDPGEKAQIQATLPSFKYEGPAWATPLKGADTVDVFRFFDTRNGDHFYTTNVVERDQVIKTVAHFAYEGVAFQAYAQPGAAGTFQLERFFNKITGEHHFSASAGESAGINAGKAGAGWVDEGAGFTVHVPSADMLLA